MANLFMLELLAFFGRHFPNAFFARQVPLMARDGLLFRGFRSDLPLSPGLQKLFALFPCRQSPPPGQSPWRADARRGFLSGRGTYRGCLLVDGDLQRPGVTILPG
jgi:hypothetical protein